MAQSVSRPKEKARFPPAGKRRLTRAERRCTIEPGMQNRQWGESLATIKDIATRAGVTATTVSRVINNRGYISKETREKVHRAMAEMHYQPNELARALSKRRANTIVAIVPHISHPFFAFLISCLEEAAAERGYKLLLCNSRQQPERSAFPNARLRTGNLDRQ